jgi:hypothetical protein
MLAEPASGGRSLYRIAEHVAESHAVYLRYLVGRVDGLSEALRGLQGPETVAPALARLGRVSAARLEALTEEERARHVPHGQVTWTARRALRRMLEHAWEHLLEARNRG